MLVENEQKLRPRDGNGLVAMPEKFIGEFSNACTDPCDMIIGPCACGASHHIRDWPEWFICILLRETQC